MTKKQKKVLIRILISAALVILLSILDIENTYVSLALYMVPYFLIGYDILIKAAKGVKNLQPFDENFLMAVATIGAIALGDYREGVSVMLFYQIGELFQSYAVGKSRRSISELMDIRPDRANLVAADGTVSEVSPDEVEIGSIIVVRPGEKIPIDGVVEDGKASLNTCALTGESVPRTVHAGDEVLSGCINLDGVLNIRTTKDFGESTVSKILELVENASAKKSRSENFIAKFARIYTPVVCISALVLALVPPLVLLAMHSAPAWGDWISRALTFLVISCPCALVISIPLTFFAGLGGASQAGVLIKGSSYMETLAQVSTVAFDKTGTLTEGNFEVVGVHHNTLPPETLIEYAALAESQSSHPISQSLQNAYGKTPDTSRVSDYEELSGRGVRACVDGHAVAVGNAKLMRLVGAEPIDCHGTGTMVHIAIDGVYAGHILIADRIKPGAADAISSLKEVGVHKTVMLTGDARAVAESVGHTLGVDDIHSELLPADKVACVEQLLGELHGSQKLAFVGDGINDAPVLSRADVGIAMGALGSDAAIEAADVVLMDDDPRRIAHAIRLSRKCLRIVYENITFALAIKLVCLVFGATGHANMWMAIFADVGVMVIAVLNAIRALHVKNQAEFVIKK